MLHIFKLIISYIYLKIIDFKNKINGPGTIETILPIKRILIRFYSMYESEIETNIFFRRAIFGKIIERVGNNYHIYNVYIL